VDCESGDYTLGTKMSVNTRRIISGITPAMTIQLPRLVASMALLELRIRKAIDENTTKNIRQRTNAGTAGARGSVL